MLKSGCILYCTEAGGKTEVTFQKTYNYSQRKVQKRRLSHLPQHITLEEALKFADLQKSKLDQHIKDVVFTFRAIIKNATRTNLPSSEMTIDDIIDGEVQISEQLTCCWSRS